MKHAILTGSFDPVTSGHENLIRRAAQMFDRVTVVILANTEKASGRCSLLVVSKTRGVSSSVFRIISAVSMPEMPPR